jgi:hypothetical protein
MEANLSAGSSLSTNILQSQPEKIHSYLDLYVAGVWNMQRTARLLAISLMLHSSQALDGGNRTQLITGAEAVVHSILMSIPFHLSESLQDYDSRATHSEQIKKPGRLLGGFLLLHPLYVITQLPFLPDAVRNTSQKWLKWIAEEMGIGQAKVMASVSGVN